MQRRFDFKQSITTYIVDTDIIMKRLYISTFVSRTLNISSVIDFVD